MLIALLCLTLDIIIFSCLSTMVGSSLLAYCMYIYGYETHQSLRNFSTISTLALIALLDTLIFGRFGLSLLYLIPLYSIAQKGQEFFGKNLFVPLSLGLIAILCQEVLIKTLILDHFFNLQSTVIYLSSTLIMIKIFETMGVRGDRSCA